MDAEPAGAVVFDERAAHEEELDVLVRLAWDFVAFRLEMCDLGKLLLEGSWILLVFGRVGDLVADFRDHAVERGPDVFRSDDAARLDGPEGEGGLDGEEDVAEDAAGALDEEIERIVREGRFGDALANEPAEDFEACVTGLPVPVPDLDHGQGELPAEEAADGTRVRRMEGEDGNGEDGANGDETQQAAFVHEDAARIGEADLIQLLDDEEHPPAGVALLPGVLHGEAEGGEGVRKLSAAAADLVNGALSSAATELQRGYDLGPDAKQGSKQAALRFEATFGINPGVAEVLLRAGGVGEEMENLLEGRIVRREAPFFHRDLDDANTGGEEEVSGLVPGGLQEIVRLNADDEPVLTKAGDELIDLRAFPAAAVAVNEDGVWLVPVEDVAKVVPEIRTLVTGRAGLDEKAGEFFVGGQGLGRGVVPDFLDGVGNGHGERMAANNCSDKASRVRVVVENSRRR